MGSSRVSNALAALSDGLTKIANYRGAKEEKAEERAYQNERDESNRVFQTTLAERGYKHSSDMADKTMAHSSAEAKLGREHAEIMFDKQEQGQNARHAQSLGVQMAGIRAAAARAAKQDGNDHLKEKLRVHELTVATANGQYNATIEAMNKEIAAIDKDEMIRGEAKKTAAKERVTAQYKPLFEEQRKAIDAGMDEMKYELGMKADFRQSSAEVDTTGKKVDGPASPASTVDATGPTGNAGSVGADKIDQAVEAMLAQLSNVGNIGMPTEQALVNGFMESGMPRADAVVAARKVRRTGAAPERFQ